MMNKKCILWINKTFQHIHWHLKQQMFSVSSYAFFFLNKYLKKSLLFQVCVFSYKTRSYPSRQILVKCAVHLVFSFFFLDKDFLLLYVVNKHLDV